MKSTLITVTMSAAAVAAGLLISGCDKSADDRAASSGTTNSSGTHAPGTSHTPGANSTTGTSTSRSTMPNSGTTGTGTGNTNSSGAAAAPDNTGKNKDHDVNKTAQDQGQSNSDVQMTAAIRRAIMDDKSMSVNAQNCKIIAEGGKVTLRGPVNSQSEKDLIAAKAKAVAGVTTVDNQLEVKAP